MQYIKFKIEFIMLVLASTRCISGEFHCKLKLGCHLNKCDPAPASWREISFNIEEYLRKKEFPIVCEDQYQTEMDTLKNAISQLQKENEEKDFSLETLKNSNKEFMETISELEKDNAGKDSSLQKLNKEFKQAISELKKDNAGKDSSLQMLDKEFKQAISQLQKENAEKDSSLQKIDKEFKQMQGNLSKMESKFDKLDEKILSLENLQNVLDPTKNSLTAPGSAGTTVKPGFIISVSSPCTYTYNSTLCYWVELEFTNYANAVKICENQGSEISQIYNKEIYEEVMEILRQIGWSWISAWIGLKIDAKTGEPTYPSLDAFTMWQPGFPYNDDDHDDDWTNVLLEVRSDENDAAQGMVNLSPSYSSNGVICQVRTG